MGAIGLLAMIATLVFCLALPASRHFHARRLGASELLRSLGHHLREPGLQYLFALGFLLLGCFVTVYNYIGYRLLAAPYGLRQSALAGLFTVYVVGMFTSTIATRLPSWYLAAARAPMPLTAPWRLRCLCWRRFPDGLK